MLKPSVSISLNGFKQYIVYGWKRDNKYLYIGQSRRFLRRVTSGHHVIGVKEKMESTDELDIWFCVSLEDLDLVEKSLIKYHKPQFNISFLQKSGWNKKPPIDMKGVERKRLETLRRQNRRYLAKVIAKRSNLENDMKGYLSPEDIDKAQDLLKSPELKFGRFHS